jgi:hypothetical protein
MSHRTMHSSGSSREMGPGHTTIRGNVEVDRLAPRIQLDEENQQLGCTGCVHDDAQSETVGERKARR